MIAGLRATTAGEGVTIGMTAAAMTGMIGAVTPHVMMIDPGGSTVGMIDTKRGHPGGSMIVTAVHLGDVRTTGMTTGGSEEG